MHKSKQYKKIILIVVLLFSLMCTVCCSTSYVGDEYDVIYFYNAKIIGIDENKSQITLLLEKGTYENMYNEEIIVCDISGTYYKQPERLLDIDKLYVGAIISFGVFKPHIYNIYIIDDIMNGNGD